MNIFLLPWKVEKTVSFTDRDLSSLPITFTQLDASINEYMLVTAIYSGPTNVPLIMRFGSSSIDTGSNYVRRSLFTTGSGKTSGGTTESGVYFIGRVTNASYNSISYGVISQASVDYKKMVFIHAGCSDGTTSQSQHTSCYWNNTTDTIRQIQAVATSAGNWTGKIILFSMNKLNMRMNDVLCDTKKAVQLSNTDISTTGIYDNNVNGDKNGWSYAMLSCKDVVFPTVKFNADTASETNYSGRVYFENGTEQYGTFPWTASPGPFPFMTVRSRLGLLPIYCRTNPDSRPRRNILNGAGDTDQTYSGLFLTCRGYADSSVMRKITLNGLGTNSTGAYGFAKIFEYNTTVDGENWELVEEVLFDGDLSSTPITVKNLNGDKDEFYCVRMNGYSKTASDNTFIINIRFNGDSGTNYRQQCHNESSNAHTYVSSDLDALIKSEARLSANGSNLEMFISSKSGNYRNVVWHMGNLNSSGNPRILSGSSWWKNTTDNLRSMTIAKDSGTYSTARIHLQIYKWKGA